MEEVFVGGMSTFEDVSGCLGDHLAVLAVAIEDSEDFAFVGDLVLHNHVLIFHAIVVPQPHPSQTR